MDKERVLQQWASHLTPDSVREKLYLAADLYVKFYAVVLVLIVLFLVGLFVLDAHLQ